MNVMNGGMPGGMKSVNWMTGMLLTPSHFLRQDQFVDECVGWMVRHCVSGSGLVGAGVRVDPQRVGLARFDPQLVAEDDGETVRLTLLFARGITPSGDAIEIGETNAIRAHFAKTALTGITEALVYLCYVGEREDDPSTVGFDTANPHQAALRRPQYQLKLGAEPEVVARSLIVGKIRRVSETLGFDCDGHFIPPCASVVAHSALHAAWTRLREDVEFLASRCSDLHKTIVSYADQIVLRGIDVRGDLEVLAFVERIVLALDTCAYEVIEPTISSTHLFQQVDRLGRRVAIALDLSAATRSFFQTLTAADAGYEVLLDEERQLLARRRTWSPREDLRDSVEHCEDILRRLRVLCEALEGKYVDYRVNRSVDSLRFVLERGGEGFYVAIATPGYPKRDGDLLTFDFSQLSLPGRQDYRILLVGESAGQSPWQVGDTLGVDVAVNPTTGPSRPVSRMIRSEVAGQRNFAVDFETPVDVATIVSLQVTVHQQGSRIRRALLYQRGRGFVPDARLTAFAAGGDGAHGVGSEEVAKTSLATAPPAQNSTTISATKRIPLRKSQHSH